MLIREIEEFDDETKGIIFQTSSPRYGVYIQRKIREKYDVKADALVECKTKKDYKRVRSLLNIKPHYSERWMIEVDLDECRDKEMVEMIRTSTTCFFYCTSSFYGAFKGFEDELQKVDVEGTMHKYYASYLRAEDLETLYEEKVKEIYRDKFSYELYTYVRRSYASNIDSILDLLEELGRGREFKTRKDISDVCGLGRNTLEDYVLSLLKEPSKTERGLKSTTKRKIRAGLELQETYGVRKYKRGLEKVVMDMIAIKVLTMSGELYEKGIEKENAGYEDRHLRKYSRYVDKLDNIPLSRLLRLQKELVKTQWLSQESFLEFYYRYSVKTLKEINK